MNQTGNSFRSCSFHEVFQDIHIGNYGGFGFSSLDTYAHRHNDYYEITLVTSGVYTHTYKDQQYHLTPGSLILMAPHSIHRLYTEPMQATFFALCVREDYFQSFVKQHFPNFESHVFSQCTTLQLDTSDATYLESLGHQMSVARPTPHVADVFTYLALTKIFHKQEQVQKNHADDVQVILSILNEPSSLHISAKSLYAISHTAAPTLIKLFKEQTGYTIVEYKNKKRMELAAKMLRETDKKVIDIAYELHYDSLSYFLSSFKKEFGVTPKEYRKKHQAEI